MYPVSRVYDTCASGVSKQLILSNTFIIIIKWNEALSWYCLINGLLSLNVCNNT